MRDGAMRYVIPALLRAFGQLFDPPILLVLAKSVGLTLLVFAGLGVGLYFALVRAFAALGWSGGGFAEATMAALVAVLAGWLLFRVVALAVVQLFADEIVAAVERKHYPGAARTARSQPLRREIANAARGIGWVLVANVAVLPVVAVLWVTGIGAAAAVLLINAWLLGRELTEMAWLRQGGSLADANPVPGSARLLLGGAIAGLMLVPLLNLLAPVIGAAAGTHVYHRRMARQENEGDG
jgi:uncharacterized protein involved in cysteine biosynthesis